jgi:two-component system nitrogen regulation sensor histidine kinase NtrY
MATEQPIPTEPAAIEGGGRAARILMPLRGWAERFGLARKAAIALATAAGAAGIVTYAALTGSSPFGTEPHTILILLNVDLALFLLLVAVVARRLVQVWIERRRGSVGSRLHTRLVMLFSVVAVTPAVIVSVFSAVFFSLGVQAWFSSQVKTALGASLAVAQAYLHEHQQTIRGDILAMAQDINRTAPLLIGNQARFERTVATQARLRALSEATVFDSSGRVIARYSSLSFSLFNEGVPVSAIQQAERGEPVILTSDNDDRMRALIKLDRFVDVYLTVGRFVEPGVLNHIERTRGAVAQFQKLEGQRSSIEITFAMVFVVVALLLLMAAIWVGLTFATRLAKPISELVSAAERVRAGDLTSRVVEGDADDEVGTLSRAFNRMTEQLGSQREGLVQANRQLDERRHFIETVLEGVSSGVLGLDQEGRLNLPNRAASDLLGINLDGRQGQKLDGLIPETAGLLERARARPGQIAAEQIEIARDGGRRTLLVRVAADRLGGETYGYVATFDDITELLSAQRKAAWSDVARRIAHEIKNPLTPIQLAAERLRRKYLKEISSDPDTFVACTDTIVRQVGDIGRLVDEFSAFARMPAPTMKRDDLVRIARQALFMQGNANPAIAFEAELGEGPVEVSCDNRQIGQALTNLLQNAVEAIEGRDPPADGAPPLAPGRVTVTLRRDGGRIVLSVADNGRGLPAEVRHRLTEPYVTTREKGTGLGLAIVRKIMEDHDGELRLLDGPAGGAVVELVFPNPSDAEGLAVDPAARISEQGRDMIEEGAEKAKAHGT